MEKYSISKTKRTALLGMLYAVAIVLSIVEGWFTPLLGLPPGVKLGLSNIVVMYTLCFLGWKEALLLGTLKSLGVTLTRGALGGLFSFAGGLCSIIVMAFLLGVKKLNTSYFAASVAGALAHNAGQLAMVALVLSSGLSFYYAPVLLVSGLAMGALTGTAMRLLIPALDRMLKQ